MQENYRIHMVRSIKAEASKPKRMNELQQRIEELEKTPEVKRYLELKSILETFSMIPVNVPEKIELAKENVFENGCMDEVCLFVDGCLPLYEDGRKVDSETFFCLDCGSIINVKLENLEQFKKEHRIINEEPIDLLNFEAGILEELRDYYFSLLMNYTSEDSLRIFTLTYEEKLQSKSR